MSTSFHRSIPALLALALVACGGGEEKVDDEGLMFAGAPVAEQISWIDVTVPVFPADPRARYAGVLDQCAWSAPRSAPCVFKVLPTLQQQVGGTPTVDQIMGRVVVSHEWQATRFRELLGRMPEDMRRLFRPLTAIVISNDVRPSFYWTYTGAIHLDPAYLWVTPEERATLDPTPDFRSAYGLDLQFTMPWRFVKDDAYAYRSRPPQGTTRTLDEVTWALAALLFHELGHANDYTSPAVMARIAEYSSIQDAYAQNYPVPGGQCSRDCPIDPIWYALWRTLPLLSSTMEGLAEVRFLGMPSSAAQRALTPADVAGYFAPDRATDHYAYSSEREDVAMLAEELLMYRHFGIERDVAVTNLPTVANPTAADYVIAWGMRGRVRDAAVMPRALFVMDRLLPESASALRAWAATLPAPQGMPAGSTWADTVVLNAPLAPDAQAKRRVALDEPVTTGPDRE